MLVIGSTYVLYRYRSGIQCMLLWEYQESECVLRDIFCILYIRYMHYKCMLVIWSANVLQKYRITRGVQILILSQCQEIKCVVRYIIFCILYLFDSLTRVGMYLQDHTLTRSSQQRVQSGHTKSNEWTPVHLKIEQRALYVYNNNTIGTRVVPPVVVPHPLNLY